MEQQMRRLITVSVGRWDLNSIIDFDLIVQWPYKSPINVHFLHNKSSMLFKVWNCAWTLPHSLRHPCHMVSANVSKGANVLSGSLTDVLIGLLYYLNMSAKGEHLRNTVLKRCQAATAKGSSCSQTRCLPVRSADPQSRVWEMSA